MTKKVTNEMNKLIKQFISLDQHQVCFSRNLFPRTGQQKKKKSIFNNDESKFLFFLFDSLHNVPELTRHLLTLRENGSIEINEVLVKIVQNSLSELLRLIVSAEIRKEHKIKNTNKIQSWVHCELHWIETDIEKILGQLPYVWYLLELNCGNKNKILKNKQTK